MLYVEELEWFIELNCAKLIMIVELKDMNYGLNYDMFGLCY